MEKTLGVARTSVVGPGGFRAFEPLGGSGGIMATREYSSSLISLVIAPDSWRKRSSYCRQVR